MHLPAAVPVAPDVNEQGPQAGTPAKCRPLGSVDPWALGSPWSRTCCSNLPNGHSRDLHEPFYGHTWMHQEFFSRKLLGDCELTAVSNQPDALRARHAGCKASARSLNRIRPPVTCRARTNGAMEHHYRGSDCFLGFPRPIQH
jgi:hypothetical protein